MYILGSVIWQIFAKVVIDLQNCSLLLHTSKTQFSYAFSIVSLPRSLQAANGPLPRAASRMWPHSSFTVSRSCNHPILLRKTICLYPGQQMHYCRCQYIVSEVLEALQPSDDWERVGNVPCKKHRSRNTVANKNILRKIVRPTSRVAKYKSTTTKMRITITVEK